MSKPFNKDSFNKKWKESSSGCWEWLAVKNQDGYGRVKRFGKLESAHRVSYELYKGALGENSVLHKCDNPSCVNPDHLFLGTQKDNVDDMIKKGRQHNNAHKGVAHYRTKLTEKEVLEIFYDTTTSQSIIASRFGISQSAVSVIKSKRNWRHLTEPLDIQ